MTAKDFFKSTAFKSVVVLLVIAIVCVGVLALLNDLLYVSDEVRFNRAMAKIYPGETFVQSQSPREASYPNGSAKEVAWANAETKGGRIAVIEAVGIGGFKDGTVTLYVVVKEADASGKVVASIAAWSIKENTSQNLIGNVKGVNSWYVGTDVANSIPFTSTEGVDKTTGVTRSSTAINNAINNAAEFARATLEMGSNPEEEARQAIVAQLADKGITTDLAEKYVVKDFAHLTSGDAVLTYAFGGANGEAQLFAFAYTVSGNLEYVVVSVSGNAKEVVLATSGADDALQGKALQVNYYAEGSLAVLSVDSSAANKYYVAKGKVAGTVPGEYKLGVTVDGSGKIVSVEVLSSGYVPGYPGEEDTLVMCGKLAGKGLSDLVDGFVDSNHGTNATESANIIFTTVKFVLEYDQNGGAN